MAGSSKRTIHGDNNNFNDISSSDDEFEFGISINENESDYNDYSDTDNSSDSEVLPRKRRRIPNIIYSEDEEDEHDTEESIEWKDVTEVDDFPPRIPFNTFPKTPGPQVPTHIKKPLEFFMLFFTDELVDSIIKMTNKYANEKIKAMEPLSKESIWKTWKDVERKEFLAFLGVIFNMGTMPLANIKEYWSTRNNSKIPFYPNTFSRNRFLQIFWMLHLKENPPHNQNIRTRIQKVNNFIEYIDSKFLQFFVPHKDISVDESVVKFKGRVGFITYNPKKPTKWGLRIYVLADSSTGYISTILPYYGSITSANLPRLDLPVTSRIPLYLFKKLLDNVGHAKGYHMYTERYYTSIPLANELLKMGCHLTGTLSTNRKGVPPIIKKPTFSKANIVACRKNNTLVLSWKDKRIVTLLSTWDVSEITCVHRILRHGEYVTIEKPQVVLNYTKNMGGVDRGDHYIANYCFLRKSLKWWRKLFFWGLEVCATNSYILYKSVQKEKNEKALSHYAFIKQLVDQLVDDFHMLEKSRGRANTEQGLQRLDGKLHIIRNGTKKDCVVCSDRKVSGGRRETRLYCDTCTRKPGIHIGECFEKYHTLKEYKI